LNKSKNHEDTSQYQITNIEIQNLDQTELTQQNAIYQLDVVQNHLQEEQKSESQTEVFSQFQIINH